MFAFGFCRDIVTEETLWGELFQIFRHVGRRFLKLFFSQNPTSLLES
jgi:hypothetical protein